MFNKHSKNIDRKTFFRNLKNRNRHLISDKIKFFLSNFYNKDYCKQYIFFKIKSLTLKCS